MAPGRHFFFTLHWLVLQKHNEHMQPYPGCLDLLMVDEVWALEVAHLEVHRGWMDLHLQDKHQVTVL